MQPPVHDSWWKNHRKRAAGKCELLLVRHVLLASNYPVMPTEVAPPKTKNGTGIRPTKLAWIILICLAGCACVLLVVLAVMWPFTRNAMIKRLEQASSAKVQMRGFHSTYFPYPGCVAEEVVFLPAAAASGAARSTTPIITIRKLTIESTLFGLLSKPHRIKRIIADGLRVHAPTDLHAAPDSQNDQLVIEELTAADALLEVGNSDKPLVFQVHHVVFHDIGGPGKVPFQVSLHMPLPPGEVESSGWLGPWKDDKGTVRSTAISGTYVLRGANLAIFKSIAGEVSSRGEFT